MWKVYRATRIYGIIRSMALPKGYYLTHEHPRGMSGKKHSREAREKMSKAAKGKPKSESFKAFMSERFSGEHNPTRRPEVREKIRQYNLGKRESLETRKKKSEAMRGENHWNWQGGKTAFKKLIRNSLLYKEWRKAIFEHDNYTCQLCGQPSNKLNADHYPISFSQLLKDSGALSLDQALAYPGFWDTDNGRTLCVPCHQGTDTYLNNYNGKRKKLASI